MDKSIYKIEAVGPISLKAGDETIRPYPIRELRLRKHGDWEYDSFVGTASDDDALLDLHSGDLIAADLSFYAYKSNSCWLQHVSIDKVIKIKEL